MLGVFDVAIDRGFGQSLFIMRDREGWFVRVHEHVSEVAVPEVLQQLRTLLGCTFCRGLRGSERAVFVFGLQPGAGGFFVVPGSEGLIAESGFLEQFRSLFVLAGLQAH